MKEMETYLKKKEIMKQSLKVKWKKKPLLHGATIRLLGVVIKMPSNDNQKVPYDLKNKTPTNLEISVGLLGIDGKGGRCR